MHDMSYVIVLDEPNILTVAEENDVPQWLMERTALRGDDKQILFFTQEEAIDYLNDNFALQFISPEFTRLTLSQVAYMRKRPPPQDEEDTVPGED